MMILEKLKQEPIIFLFRKTWLFSKGNRKKLVTFMTFFVISNSLYLLHPILIAFFLNELQQNGLSEDNFWYLVFIISGFLWLTLLFWFFHGTGRIMEMKNAFFVRHKYQTYLMKGVLDLNLTWHSNRDSGDTIDKINKGSDGLYEYAKDIFQIISMIVGGVGTIVALVYFNAYIALGTLFFVIFGFYIITLFDKRLVPQYGELNRYENKILAKVFDVLSNVTSVIVLKIKNEATSSIEKSILAPEPLFRRNIVLNEWKWFTGAFFLELIVVVPMIMYLVFILRSGSALEIGTISALYLYLSRFSNVFFTFTYLYEEIIRWKTRVLNAQSIEEAFPRRNTRAKNRSFKKELRIEHLHFNYEDDTTRANDLHDVSLVLTKGERVALIGESGSGKTTFLKVLHGLYPTAQADLILDGESLKGKLSNYDFGTMLVPQEPELFSSTIRENITFGLDHSDKEITKFTDMAHFTKVIQELPKGLESVINEKGVNLSGGQKQRLALSRALLFAQEKEVILLDESTSSVDPQTEVKIYRDIFSFFKGKTIVASIHKLHLLKYFDRVIMFKKGKIEDEGTFEELLSRNEDFMRSWENYSKSYLVE